jgi:pimeloyl-ACP methyl ester carboxylesterase
MGQGCTLRSQIDTRHQLLSHPGGETHFELVGQGDGEVVVLVPGATLPLAVWEPLVTPLTGSGFRVLRYDLPGRGYSSPLDRRATLRTFTDQIDYLLRGLGIDGRVHLVGLALGALITAAYAAERRANVARIAWIAPDGMSTRFTAAERVFTARIVGDLLSRFMADRILMARVPRYSKRPEVQSFVRELLEFALSRRDFRSAVLTTVRNLPIHQGETYYAQVAERSIPTCLIWGREDLVTPIQAADLLRELFGEDSLHLEDDLGHLPFVEDPESVAEVLISHFRSGLHSQVGN